METDDTQNEALRAAAWEDDIETVQKILESGTADVNSVDAVRRFADMGSGKQFADLVVSL